MNSPRADLAGPPSATAPEEPALDGPGAPVGWTQRWHALRYFRWRQLARRAVSMVRSRWTASRPVERFLDLRQTSFAVAPGAGIATIASRKLAARRRVGSLAERAAEIRRGRLTFLGVSLDLGYAISPDATELVRVDRLWRFHLEYHEWLLDLAADADHAHSTEAALAVWSHVAHWVRRSTGVSERSAGDAWHPFCISRRLPVWLCLWAWQPPPGELREMIARSVYAQAAFLIRRLENDLGGNHLLENARALALAGVACTGRESAAWLSIARRLIEREIHEQILPHGEHFERSPMYHIEMLELFNDVGDAVETEAPDLSTHCRETAQRMEEFAAAIRHPDGTMPLLGDSSLQDSAPLQECAHRGAGDSGRGSALPAQAMRAGDDWTFRQGEDFLLFDAGPVGPDHLPAHAHADLLTIEASIGGRRSIVDSGTYGYAEGPMRQYCRSSGAHNVLEIDGESQCEIWSRFRMGRRGWPSELRTGVLSSTAGGDFAWSLATHNAYRRLGVPVVGRWIACRAEFPWLIIDWAAGSGTHELVNRLHLHPDVQVDDVSESLVACSRQGQRLFLTALGDGRLSVEEGWHCPSFGLRLRNAVVTFRTTAALPAVVGWCLAPEPVETIDQPIFADGRIRGSVRTGGRPVCFEFDPENI